MDGITHKVAPNPAISESVGILGAGMGGLISAHVLEQDGFKDITVITRDPSVGGTWSRNRVYSGLHINKYVHLKLRQSDLCVFNS